MINRHIAYFALRCKGSLIRQHKGFFDVIVFILHGRKINFSILFSALIDDFSNLFQSKINDFSNNIVDYFLTFQFFKVTVAGVTVFLLRATVLPPLSMQRSKKWLAPLK